MLEFANIGPDASPGDPVIRVRVSSHMLAETSPIFARMFSGHSESLHLHDAEDITPQLPLPPTPYVCKDGTEVNLYRMPQYEVNKEQSLEILMHAAHMHNEMVPREVTFEQFVAIAECSIRFRSTSPLELVVEHRWLPQWMHRGADEMPDGLLVISYAFGSRQLFTRMSKSAILHVVDERDLRSKPWPPKIQDKIWAVRSAKLEQVHSCCVNTLQEYLRPPQRDLGISDEVYPDAVPGAKTSTPPVGPAPGLTSAPRCPKGSHSCDATNLGWMMLVFNEMGLSPHILQEAALSHLPVSQAPSRSIAQMVEVLRSMPSPPSPIHRGGVCDPSPAFRTAIADIYNSVTGLTLHDISGKSHGWALSKHRMAEPQTFPATGLDRMAAPVDDYTVVNEFPDRVRLQIMGEIEELEDLHAAAQINRSFYETYKTHEVGLMRSMIRADRLTRGSIAQPQRGGNAEDKILKAEADRIQLEGAIESLDAVTLASEEDYSDASEDDADEVVVDNMSVSRSAAMAARLGKQPPMNPPRYTEDEQPSSGAASPTTPRQGGHVDTPPSETEARKPPNAVTVHIEPMTDEEARRILWPDETEMPTPIALAPQEGLREKVLVGDPAFANRMEEKTLVTGRERPGSAASRSSGD